jgi:hypothetical protein
MVPLAAPLPRHRAAVARALGHGLAAAAVLAASPAPAAPDRAPRPADGTGAPPRPADGTGAPPRPAAPPPGPARAAPAAPAAPAIDPRPPTADDLARALDRADRAAIAELRAHPRDAGARCVLGAIYAARRTWPLAGLYLEACEQAALPVPLAARTAELARAARRALDASALAQVQVVSTPGGVPIEWAALPGEPIYTPATLWVPAGSYELRTAAGGVPRRYPVVATARTRVVVVLEAPRRPRGASRREITIDDEQALGERVTAPPPDVARPSLVPLRYRRPAPARPHAPPALTDPLP